MIPAVPLLFSSFVRYSTSGLLVVTAFAVLLAWSGTPTDGVNLIRYVGIVIVVATWAALRFRHGRPFVRSIAASVLFFFISLVYWWGRIWIGYFIYRPEANAPPYFEDGMIAEGIIYPFVYFGVYSPIVALIALSASALTVALANLYDRSVALKS